MDQALWRGKAWGQGIYAPRGSLLSPLLFCTATWAQRPLPMGMASEYDKEGGLSLLFGLHKAWRLAARGVRGDTRCCWAGGMQEVACGLQSLPEAQPAGLWLSQQLHVGKNQQRGRRKGDGGGGERLTSHNH